MSRLGFWKMIPTWRRTRAESREMSLPAIRMVPDVGCSVVVRMDIVVVLPAPFGPSSAKSSPGGTSKLTPSTAFTSALR